MSRRFYLVFVMGLLGSLSCLGMGVAADGAAERNAARESPAPLRIAVYGDKGAGRSLKDALRELSEARDLEIVRVTAADIRNGKLADFDVLVQPGGGAGGQAKTLKTEGREKIRRFVHEGGGYVGICAGAYLATDRKDVYLDILDAEVVDGDHWDRGTGRVEISLTERGRELLGSETARTTIYYGQGPLLAPGGDPDLPDYEPLATYETEIAKKGAPRGVMIGTSAIVTGEFGSGRVICFSPHPEKTKGLGDFLRRGTRWAARSRPNGPSEKSRAER